MIQQQRLDEIATAMRGFADELTTTAPAVPAVSNPTTTPQRKLILNEQFDGPIEPLWRPGKPGTASGGHRGYNDTEKGYYVPNRSFRENDRLILEAIDRRLNIVNNKSRQGQFVPGQTEDIWYTNGDSGIAQWQTGTRTTGPDVWGMIPGLKNGAWPVGNFSLQNPAFPSTFEFLYGQIEGRIKIPKGQGIWPAFWLLQSNGVWPPEIDILEGVDPSAMYIAQHYHYGTKDTDFTKHEGPGYPTSTDMSLDFHRYSVDWQPDYIRWFIDGVMTQEFTDKKNIPNKPMYILLNLAVGGSWPGYPTSATKFPARMEVDYVKVWQ
jgi:hypothetical protein